MMVGHLEKRSLRLVGHRTSVALEPAFWAALDDIAAARGMSKPKLMEALDADRPADQPLASYAREFALNYVRTEVARLKTARAP